MHSLTQGETRRTVALLLALSNKVRQSFPLTNERCRKDMRVSGKNLIFSLSFATVHAEGWKEFVMGEVIGWGFGVRGYFHWLGGGWAGR